MLPVEDLRSAVLDTDGGTAAATTAAYLAAKHASGQLSAEDYTLLQEAQTSHEKYLERFWHQSRHTILQAYLHNHLTVKEVLHLLRIN